MSDTVLKHMVCFDIGENQYNKTMALITEIRDSKSPKKYYKEMTAVIVALSDAGYQGFFIAPLQEIGAGVIALNAVKMGVKTIQKTMGAVTLRALKSLNDKQMLSVADVVERFVFQVEIPVDQQ